MNSTAIMPDEEATLNRYYFTNIKSNTDADIIKDRVIVTKDKSGSRGSLEYVIHYGKGTKCLEIKFGVSSHFILTVCNSDTLFEKQTLKRHSFNIFWQT